MLFSTLLPSAAVDVRIRRGFKFGNFHARHSLAGDADFLRSAERKVETAAVHVGTAIVDAHPYRASALWILDLDDGTKRQGLGRCGKLMGIVRFTTGGRPSG